MRGINNHPVQRALEKNGVSAKKAPTYVYASFAPGDVSADVNSRTRVAVTPCPPASATPSVQDKNPFSSTEIGSLPDKQSKEDGLPTLNNKHRRRSIMGTQG